MDLSTFHNTGNYLLSYFFNPFYYRCDREEDCGSGGGKRKGKETENRKRFRK
mgnify:CR=1 FL=1